MRPELAVIVTVRDEAARLPATLDGLGRAFPAARVLVADDGSRDASATLARGAGAEVISVGRRVGKGGAATLGARRLLAAPERAPRYVLLCDGDLGETAAATAPLVAAIERDEADLAVAVFARPVGGGFGLALGAARRTIARAAGCPRLRAPLSGQRALRAEHLPPLLPFARGFGMETAMAIDARRAGLRIAEIELPLAHRVTGRDLRGSLHRARQLRDILAVARRPG